MTTGTAVLIYDKFPADEVRSFQKQLRDIEASLDGHPQALPPSNRPLEELLLEKVRNFSYDANAPMGGQEIVLDLLSRCLIFCEIMMKKCACFLSPPQAAD